MCKKTLAFLILCCLPIVTLSAQTYDEWIDKSFTCIDTEDWTCAEEALLQALRKEPGNIQNSLLLSNLGTIQRRSGKKEEALKSYTNGLMITPRSTTLLMNRAALYSEMNRDSMAMEDYNQILIINDANEEAMYLRGLVRLERGDTAACRMDFERLAMLNPNSSKARIGLAALMKCRHYYSEAIDLYTQVLKSNPKMVSLYINRAEAYYFERNLNKADADIAKALELDNKDPLIYLLRGKIKLARYDKEDARKDFNKAVELGLDKNIIEDLLR